MKKIYIENPYKKNQVASFKTVDYTQNQYLFDDCLFLQETPHYPREYGRIDGVEITNIKKTSEGYLIQTKSPISSGIMEINWEDRLQFLQNSMARVLLTITVSQLLDAKTVNYYIDAKDSFLILDLKDIPILAIDKIEDLTNYILQANLLFRSSTYENSDKTEIYIGEYPPVTNYGPKLYRSGEISLIKITEVKPDEQGVKIHFVSGQQGFAEFRNHGNLIRSLQMLFHVDNNEELIKNIKRLISSRDTLVKTNKKMQEELGVEVMNEYLKLATYFNGKNYIYKVLDNVNFKELKYISAKIMDKPNYIQIYGIPNGLTSQILVCASKNLLIDLKGIFDELKEKYQLSGGGNLYRIQANCPTSELSNIMEEFLIRLKK